jgi:hypothetical protein
MERGRLPTEYAAVNVLAREELDTAPNAKSIAVNAEGVAKSLLQKGVRNVMAEEPRKTILVPMHQAPVPIPDANGATWPVLGRFYLQSSSVHRFVIECVKTNFKYLHLFQKCGILLGEGEFSQVGGAITVVK